MVKNAKAALRHVARAGRGVLGAPRIGMMRLGPALRAAPRILLLLTIVWAFTGPVNQAPLAVGASGLPPAAALDDEVLQAGPTFPETGFAVADGPIGDYFVARGGVRTFGPPISNQFPLLGETVQLFRNHLLKIEPGGNVSTVNLIGMDAVPFQTAGGYTAPDVDEGMLMSAPVPGTPGYGAQVQAFIQAHAPDQWEGLPVRFLQTFLETVHYEDAFPSGGERGLLPGFSHEVWGVPVSRPVRDAQNPNVVLLRWQRGIMAWDAEFGAVTTVPLGETFKALLTGEGLSPEQRAAAANSPFLLQFNPALPGGVVNPDLLPQTALTSAFTPGGPSVSAAQLSDLGQAAPTPTATLAPGQPVPGAPSPGAPVPGTPMPGQVGAVPAGGAPVSATPTDICYGDEQITFSPSAPRANNELLVAVTSSRPHPYGRLAGTERTTFVRERPGQLGYVWEWTVLLSWPGKHEYTFYVDSTIPCKSIEINVRQQLATRTPTPYGWDNGNENSGN